MTRKQASLLQDPFSEPFADVMVYKRHMNNTKDNLNKQCSGGFTLIELVVAILIFAIGIVGIMKMHQASIQSNNYSMQLTQALNIADDKIEFLRGINFTDANMTLGAHAAIATSMGVQYNMDWVVAPMTNNFARNVNFTISWQEKAINHQYNILLILDQL
jgi:prepilin-type N-terminal cleavage/methylation domain-containing protein